MNAYGYKRKYEKAVIYLRLCLWLLRSLFRPWEGDGEREEEREELEDGLL